MTRVLVAVAFGLFVPAAAATAGGADRCAPRAGERVLQRTAAAELYRSKRRAVGCWRASGRRTAVYVQDEPDFDYYERLNFLELDRGHVAVEWMSGDRQSESRGLAIFDLRRGRRVHWESPYLVERPEGSDRYRRAIREIEITTGGSAVWIARCLGCLEVRLRVYKVDRDGMTQLDAGPGVEEGSLRLRDHVATWRTAGERHTAPIRD